MRNIRFPLQFVFRISTISNDFRVLDANNRVIAYARQKMFKLKEDISVYNNTDKEKLDYRIKADQWIDFNTAYSIKRKDGQELGKFVRKGWRSLWKAEYNLIDQKGMNQFLVREKSALVRFIDNIFGNIPIIGLFTGYVFNPVYNVTDHQRKQVVSLKKQPSFFGRKFLVEKMTEIDEDDQERIILGLMMMILLERNRG